MISNKLVMPEHTNPFGNLFGGQMMAWMDKIAAMEAMDYTKRNCVTARVSEINFNQPVQVGDRVELRATVEKEGNSSLEIYVIALRNRLPFDNSTVVGSAHFTFVAVNEFGKADSSWNHRIEND